MHFAEPIQSQSQCLCLCFFVPAFVFVTFLCQIRMFPDWCFPQTLSQLPLPFFFICPLFLSVSLVLILCLYHVRQCRCFLVSPDGRETCFCVVVFVFFWCAFVFFVVAVLSLSFFLSLSSSLSLMSNENVLRPSLSPGGREAWLLPRHFFSTSRSTSSFHYCFSLKYCCQYSINISFSYPGQTFSWHWHFLSLI